MDNFVRIPTISVNSDFQSIFTFEQFETNDVNGMIISDRINAENFRLRKSLPGYKTDFHIAGDPTLILVQQGQIKITVNSGNSMTFSQGDLFIAKDYLPKEIDFNADVHGHSAEVVGTTPFVAVHIKLGYL